MFKRIVGEFLGAVKEIYIDFKMAALYGDQRKEMKNVKTKCTPTASCSPDFCVYTYVTYVCIISIHPRACAYIHVYLHCTCAHIDIHSCVHA